MLLCLMGVLLRSVDIVIAIFYNPFLEFVVMVEVVAICDDELVLWGYEGVIIISVVLIIAIAIVIVLGR